MWESIPQFLKTRISSSAVMQHGRDSGTLSVSILLEPLCGRQGERNNRKYSYNTVNDSSRLRGLLTRGLRIACRFKTGQSGEKWSHQLQQKLSGCYLLGHGYVHVGPRLRTRRACTVRRTNFISTQHSLYRPIYLQLGSPNKHYDVNMICHFCL